jgi:hypothetical protein
VGDRFADFGEQLVAVQADVLQGRLEEFAVARVEAVQEVILPPHIGGTRKAKPRVPA